MNIAAHQKKEKIGKREPGEERKQSTDLKEPACCPSVVVQRAAQQKIGLYKGSAWSNWNPWKGQQPF